MNIYLCDLSRVLVVEKLEDKVAGQNVNNYFYLGVTQYYIIFNHWEKATASGTENWEIWVCLMFCFVWAYEACNDGLC